MSHNAPVVEVVRDELTKIWRLTEHLHRAGTDPLRCVHGRSDAMDGLLRRLFVEFLSGDQRHVAMVAVGGYGRRQLCPHSDVDLLFVRQAGRGDEAIRRLVRVFWDGGLPLGHAVRTPEECYHYMLQDVVTATALLECRFLWGSERLYDRFRTAALNRYRKRRREFFARKRLESIRDLLEAPGLTFSVIEPNLKEGSCGLRHIQLVLWVENIRRDGGSFEAMRSRGSFSADQIDQLEDAYHFFLRARCELHLLNKVRLDVLERQFHVRVARNLGYGPPPLSPDAAGVGLGTHDSLRDDRHAVEELMGDYYRHSRNVYRFLHFYLETETKGRRFFAKIAGNLLTERPRPHLKIFKGRLYLHEAPPDGGSAQEIMEMFQISQERDVPLSESLCQWLRDHVAGEPTGFEVSREACEMFIEILRRATRSGATLKAMHRTNILSLLLPEFRRLNARVSFDGHHHFTIDEHTLKTLQELDRIEADPEYEEPEFRDVYRSIKDPLALRLALLLHDIGKAMSGKHAVRGSEAAAMVCERLGAGEAVTETVEFLVYRHLVLFNVSHRRYFDDPMVAEHLARLVQTEERLNMLYLLTYLDVRSVGPGSWTRWKGAQLQEVYQRTMHFLRTGEDPAPSLEDALLESGLDAGVREKVLDHCRKLSSPAYNRAILPERMAFHVEMTDACRKEGGMQVELEDFGEYHEITFCGFERRGLFVDLTGLLYSEGLNVLSAKIFSRSDGIVIDVFDVEVGDDIRIEVERRVERMRSKVLQLERREAVVADLMRERLLTYERDPRLRTLQSPKVTSDNQVTAECTVIDVYADDRPGLLFDLASAIRDLSLDLRRARVSTHAGRAHDVFHVCEEDGRQIDNPARRVEIEQTLAERAARPASMLERQRGLPGS